MPSKSTSFRFIQVTDPDISLIVNSNVILIRPNPELVNPEYLFHLLKTAPYHALLNSCLTGNRVKSLSVLRIRSLTLEVLPRDQQNKLIERYNTITNRFIEYYTKYQQEKSDILVIL